jgi:hypothetical protein
MGCAVIDFYRPLHPAGVAVRYVREALVAYLPGAGAAPIRAGGPRTSGIMITPPWKISNIL